MSCSGATDFDVGKQTETLIGAARAAPTMRLTSRLSFEELRVPLPISIDDLIASWNTVYKKRLEANVGRLRDDKLEQYRKLVAAAEQELLKSHAQAEIWKSVFQQRYGLAGTDWSASTFIEHAIEKNVPEDLHNIANFIRLRSVLITLERDKATRSGGGRLQPAPGKTGGASPSGGKTLALRGRPAIFSGWSDAIAKLRRAASMRDARHSALVGGVTRSQKTLVGQDEEDEEDVQTDGEDEDGGEAEDEEEKKPKGRRRRRGQTGVVRTQRNARKKRAEKAEETEEEEVDPDCKNPAPEAQKRCYKKEADKYYRDYNQLAKKHDALEKKYNAFLVGKAKMPQNWIHAAWDEIPQLPPVEVQVAKLFDVLKDAKEKLVGRFEILSRVAAIVHTFAFNHCAFSSAYLNFSLEGPPGTGKTTIARVIGDVFRYLGVILTDKFDTLAREDFVGGFLGETAIKTKAVLTSHIEGVIFLDEAYALGAGANANSEARAAGAGAVTGRRRLGGSAGDVDPYGSEAVTTIVGFLDKHQGRIIFIVAGYADRMEREFFGVNAGLARRFPYRFYLSPFTSEQLLKIFFQKTLSKIRSEDLAMWRHEPTWAYLLQALAVLNTAGHLPNQGGDLENIANNALIYVNTYVRARDPRARFLNPCDMQQVLREYLFSSRRANIVIGNDALNRECNSFRSCSDPTTGEKSVCIPLMMPNTALGRPRARQLSIAESFAQVPEPPTNTATAGPGVASKPQAQPRGPAKRRRGGRHFTRRRPPLRAPSLQLAK